MNECACWNNKVNTEFAYLVIQVNVYIANVFILHTSVTCDTYTYNNILSFADYDGETPRGQFEDKRSRNCPYLDTINRYVKRKFLKY